MTRFLRVYEIFERVINVAVLILLMVVVLWGTVRFGIEVFVRIAARATGAPPNPEGVAVFLQEFSILRDVFGGFLLILIGVELMKTVVTYLESHELHVETVFTVAMIAIARHAIDLDLHSIEPLTLIGMAATILGLAVGYYLFRKANEKGAKA